MLMTAVLWPALKLIAPDGSTPPLKSAALAACAPLPLTAQLTDELPLKSPLRAGLNALKSHGCRVTSLHPMFGPSTELLSGRHVIFVDAGSPEATAAARELFASTMVEQVVMSLDDHDRLIAYVLGLSHALNIAFFTALAEASEGLPTFTNYEPEEPVLKKPEVTVLEYKGAMPQNGTLIDAFDRVNTQLGTKVKVWVDNGSLRLEIAYPGIDPSTEKPKPVTDALSGRTYSVRPVKVCP